MRGREEAACEHILLLPLGRLSFLCGERLGGTEPLRPFGAPPLAGEAFGCGGAVWLYDVAFGGGSLWLSFLKKLLPLVSIVPFSITARYFFHKREKSTKWSPYNKRSIPPMQSAESIRAAPTCGAAFYERGSILWQHGVPLFSPRLRWRGHDRSFPAQNTRPFP